MMELARSQMSLKEIGARDLSDKPALVTRNGYARAQNLGDGPQLTFLSKRVVLTQFHVPEVVNAWTDFNISFMVENDHVLSFRDFFYVLY